MRGGKVPNHAAEKCVDVSRGNLITGISARVNDGNVTHLQACWKKWSGSTLRLTGSEHRKLADGQSGVREERILKVADFISGAEAVSRTLITRVGFRENNDNLANIYFETRSPCTSFDTSSCSTATC